jgi:hypothetical protein
MTFSRFGEEQSYTSGARGTADIVPGVEGVRKEWDDTIGVEGG